MRVLLSSTDAGAAHHMTHLARLLEQNSGYEPVLYAGPVAARIFEQSAVLFTPFPHLPEPASTGTAEPGAALMEAACSIVARHRPDLQIGGLSNIGHGPDEALGAAVRQTRPGCVTATLLDDRGPLYTLDGRYADHLLATSPVIERWARDREHSQVHMIGSLKHQALSRLPADEIRLRARAGLGLAPETRLVTFIAQTDAMEGHNERFLDLVDILQRIGPELPAFELYVRVHPGAPKAGEWCYQEARRRGLPARRDHLGPMTDILAASDALFSCSSTSMTDYVWLSMGGTTLTAVPVYLLGKSLRLWLTRVQGDWRPDLVELGLASMADDSDDLEPLVRSAVTGDLTAPNADREVLRHGIDPFQATMQAVARMAHAAATADQQA